MLYEIGFCKRKYFSPPSEQHFWRKQFVWMTRRLRYDSSGFSVRSSEFPSLRSGTRRARRGTTASPPCTTGERRPPSSSMISPTPTHSREQSPGWRNFKDRWNNPNEFGLLRFIACIIKGQSKYCHRPVRKQSRSYNKQNRYCQQWREPNY